MVVVRFEVEDDGRRWGPMVVPVKEKKKRSEEGTVSLFFFLFLWIHTVKGGHVSHIGVKVNVCTPPKVVHI